MFFFYRFLRNSTHPLVRWGFLTLLTALGVGLIVWGLVGHDTIILVRGLIELVIVAVIYYRVFRPSGMRSGTGPNSLR